VREVEQIYQDWSSYNNDFLEQHQTVDLEQATYSLMRGQRDWYRSAKGGRSERGVRVDVRRDD
jgi:hypothetical protein